MAEDTHGRLLSRLRELAVEIERLTSGLDEGLLAKRTVPGKWSLKELICHLWRVQQLFEGRIDAMLSQTNPPIIPYEPESDPEFERMVATLPAQQSLRAFLAERNRFIARLEALSPAHWRRPGRHPEFPHYDLHFQVEYLAHHEAHHLYQIFQRRAHLGQMPP
jgi:hypothetical protein